MNLEWEDWKYVPEFIWSIYFIFPKCYCEVLHFPVVFIFMMHIMPKLLT